MSFTVLSNRYRVLNVLGDGGFGKTFLVEDTQMPSNRKCVLKQLKPVHNGTDELRQLVQDRFQREAATLEMLGEGHGQIPCLYAYFLEDEQFYLVQEWIDGVTIAETVQREGPQSEQIVKTMIAELLGAIAYIHSKGIVHRDIKPDNIILRRHDNKPVLIDFGAVKETMNTIVDSQGYSTRSIVVGTPGYMPTEQLAGRPVYASDIYSLGMTAVYMLTGKLPQEMLSDPASGELLWREHAPDISPAFATFLDTAIYTSTHSRFSTVQQMQTELQRLTLGADPTQVSPVPTLYPAAEHSSPSVRPQVPVSASAPTLANAPVSVQDGSGSYPPPTQSNSSPANSSPANSSPANSSPAPSSKNALIIGSLVGVSILLGAAMMMIGLDWSSVVSELPAEPLEIEPPLPESVFIPDPVPTTEPVEPSLEPPTVVEPPVSDSPWAFMGTASSGESVSVNVNSIRVFPDAVDFEYQIGDERILASADCFGNRWFAEQYGWYSPQSDATQSMLDFVCQ